jgi:hypothetical protein
LFSYERKAGINVDQMNQHRILLTRATVLALALATCAFGRTLQPAPKCAHYKGRRSHKLFFTYEASCLSLAAPDDDDAERNVDCWSVRIWVRYKRGKKANEHPAKRPTWTTDREFLQWPIAPDVRTYFTAGAEKLGFVRSDYGLAHRHIRPKNIAGRFCVRGSAEPHALLNALPKLRQHNGIWKTSKNSLKLGLTNVLRSGDSAGTVSSRDHRPGGTARTTKSERRHQITDSSSWRGNRVIRCNHLRTPCSIFYRRI